MKHVLIAILMSLIVAFTACTGKNDGGSSVDAEGYMGRKPKFFYHLKSTGQVSIIELSEDRKKALKLAFDSVSGLSQIGEISISLITLSSDEKTLTIQNAPEVYEAKDKDPVTLTTETVVEVKNNIEAVCRTMPDATKIGSTEFTDVQIKGTGSPYSISAFGAAGETAIGSAMKETSYAAISYDVTNFGKFKIDFTSPSSTDSQYFKTTVTNAAWFSANNLYCHINQANPIIPPVLQSAISSQALGYAETSGYGSSWAEPWYAVSNDGMYSQWGPDMGSNPLQLTGYFNSNKPVPSDAIVTGIKVNCKWDTTITGLRYVVDSEIRLLKAGQTVGENKAVRALIPTDPTLSSDYGGTSDLWGTTWSPAEINDMTFGVQIVHEGNSDKCRGRVDYCQIQVYWH